MSEQNQNTYVATVNVRDDFFNDPFFKDWWSDFEGPISVLDSKNAGGQRRTLVDSFLALKENNDDRSHTYQQSGSAQAAKLNVKDGLFKLEVDLHEFEAEDIDISVEGDTLTLIARKEIKRGNSSSFREFNEKFAIPNGVDVTKLSSEITGDGILIITGPQVEDIITDESHKGDTDVSSSSEGKKTSSESHFEVEGGRGTTRKNEASNKTRRESVTKRVTEDGWEEEIYEEYEEEEVNTKSTTVITANSAEGVKVPVNIEQGGVGSRQTVEVVSSNQNMKVKDGKVLEIDNSSNRRTQNKEIIIPIQVEGQPTPTNNSQDNKPKTPRPRELPFHFPSLALPSLPPMPLMPSISPFDMRMPSASDMMAQMQVQMQQQMAFHQMQMAQMHQANMLQMEQMMMPQQGMMALNYQQQQMSQQNLQQQQMSQQSIQQQHMSQQNIQQQQMSQQNFHQSNQQGMMNYHQQTEQGYDSPNLVIEDIDDDQDYYVPLKQIGKVDNRNALSEATAMAKMKDEMFELVININGFDPEDVEIYCVDQSVYVKAKHVTEQGFVNNVYEQKFNLPEDVETEQMTSGMSRDGILMIRVPRRESPEKVIPITREVKLEAVKKGLAHYMKYDVEISETSSEQIKAEFEEKHIEPMKVEKEEDVVKAASAEVIESMTVGVAETSGAEAGEVAGIKSAVEYSKTATAVKIASAVQEAVARIGFDIAGEAGVKAALEAALDVATEIGIKVAGDMAAEIGAEVGRIAGGQAATVAGAEELAKMNMAEITEEKAQELRSMFEELGVKIGSEAGQEAGKDAGTNIDPSSAIREAVLAAKEIAEDAAYKVKEMLDMVTDEAKQIGSKVGELAGKIAGEKSGEAVATDQAVKAGIETAKNIIFAVLGENGEKIGEETGKEVGNSIAKKMGKEMGGSAGFAAGRIAGAKAAAQAAKDEAAKVSSAKLDNKLINELFEKIKEAANLIGKEAGSKAGDEAGSKIDIGLIVAEVMKATKKASEQQAYEIKAFETMCANIAMEAGEKSGKIAGTEAGGLAGVEVAVKAAVQQAIEESEKIGRAIFGDEGASVARVAGEACATEMSMRLGKEMGCEVGATAGKQTGGEEAHEEGRKEALKHNVFELTEEDINNLQNKMREIGSAVGKEKGALAGREAGSKINLPYLVKEVVMTAAKAAEQAANMAKAEGDEAQAQQMEKMAVECAVEAAKITGEESCYKATQEELEQFIIENVDKISEEAGALKGKEVFGDFGSTVGAESGLAAGRKAAFELAVEMLKEMSKEEGKIVAAKEAELSCQQQITKENLKSLSKDKIAQLKQKYTEMGQQIGLEVGKKIAKSTLTKLDMEKLKSEAIKASAIAAEKYAIKAREFQKLAMKIAEDAGGASGEETGEEEGGEAGEKEGGIAGEKVGREAGSKAGMEIAGEEGARVGGDAGAKAGMKFGHKVGREAGLKVGAEVGRTEGKKAGRDAGAAEALKMFTIGITKERVAVLKKTFQEVGTAAGILVGKTVAKTAAAKKGEEEGSKFGLEQGRKAGVTAAKKLKDNEGKQIKEEGAQVAEKTGNEVGAKSGASAGEKAAGEEAARLGGDEGERVGRELAGDAGAQIGREVGAEAARQAGAKHGRKVGKLAGMKAGLAAAKTACIEHVQVCTKEISRERVTALRKLFAEIASGAAQKAAMEAARAAVMRDIYEIAIRAAGRAAREKILAMASRGQIRLKSDWKPTSIIGVINARSDLSDMEKVRLAAKSKMDSNISDLLPCQVKGSTTDDPLVGKLKFNESSNNVVRENLPVHMETAGKKWKSVMITDMPEEKRSHDMTKDNVNSLKKRFETKSLKNNEAYIIM